MKRSLILMPLLFRGGSEKQIRLIIEAINKRGLPLSVVIENTDLSMLEEEQEFVIKNSAVDFIILNTGAIDAKYKGWFKKYVTKLNSIKTLTKLLKVEIKRKNIETVMVTNLTGLVMVPLFNRLNCHVIYNERNPGVKVCSSFWKRRLLNQCYKVIANSKSAAKYMSDRLGCNVEVFNNGVIETGVVNRPEKNDIFKIFVPARISSVKNQMVIIKAVNLLKNKLQIKVIFAGVTEEKAYYNDLMKFIDDNKLDDYFEFIGFTDEVYKYYEKCNLLILPSYEEGTPNVLLESFICKLPVLASNIPMNADCMMEKSWLFNPDKEQDLAEKILMIVSLDSQKKQDILQKNYEYVIENYAIDKMKNRYYKLLYGID